MRPEEGFIRWLYPLFILLCASWAWRLLHQANLARIERETIAATTVFFTLKFVYYLFWGSLEHNWVEIESTYWVMAFVMVLAYIVLDARMGLVYSLVAFEKVGAVSASFGVAEGHIGDSIHNLVERADKVLYQAKSLGRNRVEISPA